MKKVITSFLFLTSLIAFGQNQTIEDLWKLYQSQDYNLVIEKATPLLDTDSNKVDLSLLLGRAYADKGKFKEALPYLYFTVINDNHNTWRKAWALAYLALVIL
ncbi:MAG: hypothetical protein WD824_08035 [Cyclobacteriaceae bacterium]